MKNKIMYPLLVVVASIFVYSCEDFIAVDLAKKSITVLSPANNVTSSSYSQLFKWEDLKGATSYQLQIVKPDFAAIQQFVLDTTTKEKQFSFVLSPGTYQWRIRALNNSSQSQYQTYNLTIDSTQDLSFSQLPLDNPADGSYSKTLTNTFSWLTLPFTDSYVFEVLSGGTSIYQSPSTTASSGNYTFVAEGVYQWRAYAKNSTSISGFYTRTITIDTTRPTAPTPVFPIYDTVNGTPIHLKWNTTSGADSSHLIISAPSDSTFSTIPLVDTVIEKTGTLMTYNFYLSVSGSRYFWKVQDVDKAGNQSAYFTRRRIKRN